MADRYLFKAKRIDNGEWITGHVAKSYSVVCIISPLSDGDFKWYVVEADTVCQCTGLKDKNGKLIWENDIVKGKYWQRGESHRHIGLVKWLCSAYKVVGVKQYEGWHDELSTVYEVIGNKFDNPELLEEES